MRFITLIHAYTVKMISGIKCLFIFLLMTTSVVQAQQFGLSFSYFIPKNGYLSTPISPFSIRGVGVNLTDFLSLETGGSLYRMSGLNLKDLPFESKEPLIGPNFTVFVPAELVLMLKGGKVELDLKGGGFFFYAFDNKINYGNLDRAIREYEDLEVVNSDVKFKSKPGFGYHAGAELTVYLTSQFGVSFETNYLVGQAGFPVEGSYTGSDSGALSTEAIDYKDAKIDFTGLEFSISLIFDTGGGPSPGKKSRKKKR